MKAVGIWVAAILGGIALIIGLFFATGWFSIATSDFRGEVDKHNKVEANGDYRIAAYDHFYDTCAAVRSKETTISYLRVEATTATGSRKTQIEGAITANQIARNELINQYNVDARKSYTSGQFKASDLPYQLDQESEQSTC